MLTRSEYPLSKPALDLAIAQAHVDGWLGTDILGSGFDFDVTIVEGAGSYVVGEETALLACLQGLRGTVSARPPFPAERGVYNRPTVVNNVETLCNMGFIAAHGADAYAALSPDSETNGSKLVCFNERFVNPTIYEVPFGMSMRELCEDVAGGLKDGRAIKAIQLGGPLGGILPASKLDTAFDFDALAAEGCMVGHGSILAFDDQTDMREVATHLLRFGAHESCGKCFPCRIGLKRAYDEFASDARIDKRRFEAAARGAGARVAVCARGRHPGADALAAAPLPRRAGAGVDVSHRDRRRQRDRGGRRHDDPAGGQARRRLDPDPVLRRAPGAVRRLPRLHGARRGRPEAAARVHDSVP